MSPPLDTLDSRSILEEVGLLDKIIHVAQYLLEKQSERNIPGWQLSLFGQGIVIKPFLVEKTIHSNPPYSLFTLDYSIFNIGCSDKASIGVNDSVYTDVDNDVMEQVYAPF